MARRGIGIELNPEYCGHAEKEIVKPPRWWVKKKRPKPKPKDLIGQGTLF